MNTPVVEVAEVITIQQITTRRESAHHLFAIRRGDRVALLVTNRTEWLVAAFGAAKIGAVVAALSTFSTPRDSLGLWSIPAPQR